LKSSYNIDIDGDVEEIDVGYTDSVEGNIKGLVSKLPFEGGG